MQTRYFSFFVKLLLLTALIIGVERFCHKKTASFTVNKICSNLSFDPKWEVAPLAHEKQEQVRAIFDQKFAFLGKGAQCFAFESADGNYVLKFFRFTHMRPSFFISHLPSFSFWEHYKQKRVRKKEIKLLQDFTSYKIAYEELKEETGLVFIHLNKTQNINKSIHITDKLGICHTLELDEMHFILQKKARLFYPVMQELIEQGQVRAAQRALKDLVDFLILRNQKGIDDKDPDLLTNFGFIDSKLIQIDIGRFKKSFFLKSRKSRQEELLRITDRLQKWLEVRNVELSDYLRTQIDLAFDTTNVH